MAAQPAITPEVRAMMAKIAADVDAMTPEERRALAKAYAKAHPTSAKDVLGVLAFVAGLAIVLVIIPGLLLALVLGALPPDLFGPAIGIVLVVGVVARVIAKRG
jgi:hypothetical protein